MFQSIKVLEIEASMQFNFDFANNTVLPCLFFFFLIMELYFLISAAIAHMFNLLGEHFILIWIQSKEAKSENEIHPVIVKAKI